MANRSLVMVQLLNKQRVFIVLHYVPTGNTA